jgi:hypothetical protein
MVSEPRPANEFQRIQSLVQDLHESKSTESLFFPSYIHFWSNFSIVVINQGKVTDYQFAVRDEVDRNDGVSRPIPQD